MAAKADGAGLAQGGDPLPPDPIRRVAPAIAGQAAQAVGAGHQVVNHEEDLRGMKTKDPPGASLVGSSTAREMSEALMRHCEGLTVVQRTVRHGILERKPYMCEP